MFLWGLVALGVTGLSRDDRCIQAETARPAELWCVDDEKAWTVGAQKECNNASVLFCRRRECMQSPQCAQEIIEMFIDTEGLRDEDTRRFCSCMGDSYAVTTDLKGFLQCVHRADLSPPLSRSFYIETNTLRYTFATCDQLARCMAVQAYDDAKLWLSVKNLTSCNSYYQCTQNKLVAAMAECLFKAPFTIIDSESNLCSSAQNQKICEPETKAVYCNNCAGYGAIAEAPGEAPVASVCAYSHSCKVKDPTEDYAQQKCEAVLNNERGEWCPTLSEAIKAYPPVVPPYHLFTSSELCSQCEATQPIELCCAYNNSYKLVADESQCTAQGDNFCPSVPCSSSTACQYAFAQESQVYTAKSYVIIKELCDCLGEDYRLIRQQNGFYVCVSLNRGGYWNDNVWDLRLKTRTFEAVTCQQLARCEAKSALNNALYVQSLPAECQDVRECDTIREKDLADACFTETIYDMNGKKCSAEESRKYCNAEATASACLACPNGIGLLHNHTICVTGTICSEVVSREECSGYFCPDILDRIPLTHHEMCRVCEIDNPHMLCCANADSNEARTVDSSEGCTQVNDVMCADVPCEVSAPCTADPQEQDDILLDLCNCLGPDYIMATGPVTGKQYCSHGPTHEPWDAYETVGNTARFKSVRCSSVETCMPGYLTSLVGYYSGMGSACAHEKNCFDARSKQKEKICAGIVSYKDAMMEVCTEEEKVRYCKGVSSVTACGKCQGGLVWEDAVCADGVMCEANSTKEACRGVFCPDVLRGVHAPVELGPTAKNTVVHVPIPPPPPPSSATGWWAALAVSLFLCISGVIGVHVLQHSRNTPAAQPTALDYNTPTWHDYTYG